MHSKGIMITVIENVLTQPETISDDTTTSTLFSDLQQIMASSKDQRSSLLPCLDSTNIKTTVPNVPQPRKRI